MNQLRNYLDRLRPSFSKDGQFEKFSAIYEMVDNLIYTPSTITKTAPHVRDGINLKRVMTFIVLAVLPCFIVGIWNIGYQANTAMTELIIDSVPGWRGDILELLGVNYNPDSIWDDMWHGLVYVIPVFVVALVVGGAWEILFAIIRKRNMSEGILAISLLFTLTLPPSIPLWQVAIGISFGVVIGKEVFGGTGKNFINRFWQDEPFFILPTRHRSQGTRSGLRSMALAVPHPWDSGLWAVLIILQLPVSPGHRPFSGKFKGP